MKLKMKNRPQRYDINRPRPRNGQKYTKCKMFQNNLIIRINQYLCNIWSSIHEKVEQHGGWAENS